MAIYLFIYWRNENDKYKLLGRKFNLLTNKEIHKLLSLLLEMLESKNQEDSILLNGFLSFHKSEFKKYDENFEERLKDKEGKLIVCLSSEELMKENEKLKENLIKFFLKFFIRLRQEDIQLLILASRISFYMLKDHWQTLKYLKNLDSKNLNILEKLVIMNLKNDIKGLFRKKLKKKI